MRKGYRDRRETAHHEAHREAHRKGRNVFQGVVRESETQFCQRIVQRIVPWMPVLDASGTPVGHVSDPTYENGYLLVEKGFFFTKLVYVPLHAVTRTDAFGVHVGVQKEDLNDEVYAAPLASAAVAG